MEGCQWQCAHSRQCGWGTVECQDALDGGWRELCEERAQVDPSFPDREKYMFESCFEPCFGYQGLHSMCAVTINHLDEQYGSVDNLIQKTCLSDSKGKPNGHKPDLIILMTQELNHANGFITLSAETNVFPKYVNNDALLGYAMSGECVGELSANTAVFVREGRENQLYPHRLECTREELRSTPCAWSNCKGSIVMGLHTSFGKLVVGNWHGHRAGTESTKRVEEFEAAVSAIHRIEPYRGKKLVVLGGDINVRSWFGEKNDPYPIDPRHSYTGSQLYEQIPDILGHGTWTMDQHLSGEVGLSEEVKDILSAEPLHQAKGWNTLCPTKTKTPDSFIIDEIKEWDGTYKKGLWGTKKRMVAKEIQVPNLECHTPADQMASGESVAEYTSMEKLYGSKSNTPSWTERIFLSKDLFDACGKIMKDTRNRQDDHDAVFVHCSLDQV